MRFHSPQNKNGPLKSNVSSLYPIPHLANNFYRQTPRFAQTPLSATTTPPRTTPLHKRTRHELWTGCTVATDCFPTLNRLHCYRRLLPNPCAPHPPFLSSFYRRRRLRRLSTGRPNARPLLRPKQTTNLRLPVLLLPLLRLGFLWRALEIALPLWFIGTPQRLLWRLIVAGCPWLLRGFS